MRLGECTSVLVGRQSCDTCELHAESSSVISKDAQDFIVSFISHCGPRPKPLHTHTHMLNVFPN